jgi:hypothetical protein
MSHLGEKLTEWADGRSTGDEAEWVHRHLQKCRECRDLADAERLIKARLSTLLDPVPEPTFLVRLAAMGGPNGPMTPRPGRVPGTPRVEPVASPRAVARSREANQRRDSGGRPPLRLDAMGPKSSRPRRSRRRAAMIGALSLVGVGVVSAGVVGLALSRSSGVQVNQVGNALISLISPGSGGTPGPVPSVSASSVQVLTASDQRATNP